MYSKTRTVPFDDCGYHTLPFSYSTITKMNSDDDVPRIEMD